MQSLVVQGGTQVGRGHYWSPITGEQHFLGEAGVLPGDASYLKLSPAAVLALAPFLGLAYALFLPFIGMAMFVGVVTKKLFDGAVEALWKTAVFGWRPSEAYLLGRRNRRDADREKTRAPAKTPPDRGPTSEA